MFRVTNNDANARINWSGRIVIEPNGFVETDEDTARAVQVVYPWLEIREVQKEVRKEKAKPTKTNNKEVVEVEETTLAIEAESEDLNPKMGKKKTDISNTRK